MCIRDRVDPSADHPLDGSGAVGDLGDHIQVRLSVDDEAHAVPHQRVIVSQEHPGRAGARATRELCRGHRVAPAVVMATCGTVRVTVVPEPGTESTSSRPRTSRARSAMPIMPCLLYTSRCV